MQISPNRRFVYRQLILPQEYQQKLIRVKQIIQEYANHKPSSEVTLMCLIDEFLNLHVGGPDSETVDDDRSNHDANQQGNSATSNGGNND